MRNNWRVAKVQELTIIPAKEGRAPVTQVRFRLLETYRFQGKKIGKVFASFSTTPEMLWKLKNLLDSIEVTFSTKSSLELPNRQLIGRYCKVLLAQEEWLSFQRLTIRRFAPLNSPLDLRSPAEIAAEGLEALGLEVAVDEDKLILSGPWSTTISQQAEGRLHRVKEEEYED